jgi:alanine dehydrogenase
MPGAVGRTSTFALCNVTLPWALKIVEQGIVESGRSHPPIAAAVNMFEGKITNRPVAETFGMDYAGPFAAV